MYVDSFVGSSGASSACLVDSCAEDEETSLVTEDRK